MECGAGVFRTPETDGIHVAGSAAGIWETNACFESGAVVAAKVIAALGGEATTASISRRWLVQPDQAGLSNQGAES